MIAVRGGLHGLPGTEGGIRPDAAAATGTPADPAARAATLQNPRRYEFESEPDEMLRIERPGREPVLVSRNARELAFHLRQTLSREEPELLFDQVISDRTKDAYQMSGRNPRDAADFLMRHREQVLRMIQNLHLAERLPLDLGDVIGPNQYRLTIPEGLVDPPLPFRTFEYVFEPSGCRLLMLQ